MSSRTPTLTISDPAASHPRSTDRFEFSDEAPSARRFEMVDAAASPDQRIGQVTFRGRTYTVYTALTEGTAATTNAKAIDLIQMLCNAHSTELERIDPDALITLNARGFHAGRATSSHATPRLSCKDAERFWAKYDHFPRPVSDTFTPIDILGACSDPTLKAMLEYDTTSSDITWTSPHTREQQVLLNILTTSGDNEEKDRAIFSYFSQNAEIEESYLRSLYGRRRGPFTSREKLAAYIIREADRRNFVLGFEKNRLHHALSDVSAPSLAKQIGTYHVFEQMKYTAQAVWDSLATYPIIRLVPSDLSDDEFSDTDSEDSDSSEGAGVVSRRAHAYRDRAESDDSASTESYEDTLPSGLPTDDDALTEGYEDTLPSGLPTDDSASTESYEPTLPSGLLTTAQLREVFDFPDEEE